ncbi:MAG: acyl-CoA reductase [Candidatus Ozemobacteraceae bacterium]
MFTFETPFIFGKTLPGLHLTPEAVPTLLSDARACASGAGLVPMATVFSILDRVAEIWSNRDGDLYRSAMEELPGITSFSAAMVAEGLAVVAALCRSDGLRQRLRGDLGDGGAALLDGWVSRPDLGYDLRALPHAPVLHLTAGNVFVGAVDSLLAGIITKNVNILKMSHVDPVFPVLFLESLRRSDPDNHLWNRQAIASWKGGDDAVEGLLLKSDLTVVFWGGREALASVKARVGEGTRLIENGPRYSFAVAEAELLDAELPDTAVRGLALDLVRWDQQACSSPHVVYVIGSEDEPVYRLMKRLSTELVPLSEQLPLGTLTFDEKVEIRRLRELTTMAQAFGEAVLVASDRFDFTLIFERSPLFRVSCLNRTLFFKRVASVDELMEHVSPISAFLQTVGLLVRPETRPAIERRLLEAGAKRLTSWGGMSEGREGAPHEGAFLLSRLVEWVDRETSAPTLDDRLDRLFALLPSSPYYRPLIESATGSGLARLAQLPLLDRETFYRNSPPVSEAILTGPLADSYVYASGGTTGEPKYTFYRNDEYRVATDELALIYRTAGITPSDIVGNLFLAGNLWTSFNVAGRALENIGCLNLPIGGASDFGNIIKYLQTFRATAIVGLPSIIVKLAEEVKRLGVPLRIEKILYGGEHLRAPTIQFLRDTLGCSWVRSAGYACVDTGPIGYQCTYLQGTVHHVLTSYQHIELLAPEDLKPVLGDAVGEIVATNLNRSLMPVLRYRTGDLGRWIVLPACPCGFTGPTFELLGRCDDLLVIGGLNLLPSDVAAGLAKLPVSPNFQLVARLVDGKERLLLRMESVNEEESLSHEQVVAALSAGSYKFEEALRDGWLMLDIELLPAGGLPRNSRTGKIRVVVDERL